MTKLNATSAIVLMSLAVSTSAQAGPLTSNFVDPNHGSELTVSGVVDYDGSGGGAGAATSDLGLPGTTITLSGGSTAIRTDNHGAGWNPFGHNNGYYLSIVLPGSATFTNLGGVANGVYNTLSFVWGSINGGLNTRGLDTVTFYRGTNVVGEVDGVDLVPLMVPGDRSMPNQQWRMATTFNVAGGFDKFVLSANSLAYGGFETTNFKLSNDPRVPGPIAGAGLPFLIAGAALWMRRRNSRSA